MGFYIRYLVTDDRDTSLVELGNGLHELDSRYEVRLDSDAEHAAGDLLWDGRVYGEIEVNRPGHDLFDEEIDDEGRPYCRIKVRRTVVATAPVSWKAFQGWRYLEPERAPPDLSRGDSADMPDEMASELKRLGLL